MEGAGDEEAATVGAETHLVDGVDVLLEEAVCGRGRGRVDGALGAGARHRRRRGGRGIGGRRAVVRRGTRGGRRGSEARRARDGRRGGARAALDARVGLRARPRRRALVRVRRRAVGVAGGERELVLDVGAGDGQVVFVLASALEHTTRADLVEQLEIAGRRVPELERPIGVPSGAREKQRDSSYK